MEMKMFMILGISLLGLAMFAFAADDAEGAEPVVVTMETSAGTITLELYPESAPVTVKNFVSYVEDGHFNDTVFHRVIPGFMIQGGGFTADMDQKPTKAPIVNEAENGLKNNKGTIAMARTMDVNSASSQFFINLVDNSFLNFRDATPSGYGYCVFGRVTDGMDVVEKIGATKTGSRGVHQDVPVTPITITSATVK